jgi:hypothetical protein
MQLNFIENQLATFPVVQGLTAGQGATEYYAHEVGINEVAADGTITAITSYIQSGDFDLDQGGDGEFFIKIRRFVPDFKILTGDAKVTLLLRDYPADIAISSTLGPFTINANTDKVDTRARARLAALKIENDAANQNWRLGLFRFDFQPDGRR